MKDLSSYIQAYHKDWDRISKLESYKWRAFKHFRENKNKDYNNIGDWLCSVFGKTENLLTASKYLPLGMLKEFSGWRSEELQSLFDVLIKSKNKPTIDNVRTFIDGTKSIMQSMADNGYSDWSEKPNLSTYQDAHAVSVYLAMSYPNDFYIYKYSIFRDFSKVVGYSIKRKNAIERLFEYQTLCNSVKEELKKDCELIDFYRYWLKSNNYKDDNLNLLTQDFIYAVARYLNSDTYKKVKGNKDRIRKFEQVTEKDLVITQSRAQHSYKGVKGINYNRLNKQNEDLGYEGELWVVNYERERLARLNLNPALVKHSSKEDGDGCGYDVLSIEDDGITPRYIEVKTTVGDLSQPLFFSDNELRFSIDNRDYYYLYRVYNFQAADKPADLTIIKAGLDKLNAEPVSYRAKIEY